MGKMLSKEEWMRRRKLKNRAMLLAVVSLMLAIFIVSALLIGRLFLMILDSTNNHKEAIEVTLSNGTVVSQMYLTPNPYSRPQTRLKKVKGVVIHYTANPGTTAEGNRNYFQDLAKKKTISVSSHYIVGLEGEIIQCVPLTEIAYASNGRNKDTISIECCHEDETGEFNPKTYQSLISLVAALCIEFDLEEEDIIRHYDVTKKLCPLYYVEHEEAWGKLKADIMEEVGKAENNMKAENK